MSNKALILPQLDKLQKRYLTEIENFRKGGVGDEFWIEFREGCLHALRQFRLMLEGVDVTVGLEVDDEQT